MPRSGLCCPSYPKMNERHSSRRPRMKEWVFKEENCLNVSVSLPRYLLSVTNFYLTLFLSRTFYLFFTITSKHARHASTLPLPHDFMKLRSASALQCSILHVLCIAALAS